MYDLFKHSLYWLIVQVAKPNKKVFQNGILKSSGPYQKLILLYRHEEQFNGVNYGYTFVGKLIVSRFSFMTEMVFHFSQERSF